MFCPLGLARGGGTWRSKNMCTSPKMSSRARSAMSTWLVFIFRPFAKTIFSRSLGHGGLETNFIFIGNDGSVL